MTHCPKCGGELEFDEVDVGVGTIRGNPGCPDCHWTPDQETDDDVIVVILVACPRCGAEHEDLDGFGVVFCDKCGYCQHLSITGDVCGICGQKVEDQVG